MYHVMDIGILELSLSLLMALICGDHKINCLEITIDSTEAAFCGFNWHSATVNNENRK